MKKLELIVVSDISDAYKQLKKKEEETKEVCFANFNGIQIMSTDTEDEMYKKITGKTKEEFIKAQKDWRDEYERKELEHKEKIPSLTEEYRKRARGLVVEEQLEFWDKIVPIRLDDLYHGMELEETLKACQCMRNEKMTYDERLHMAYDLFMNSGHSGMSASLTAAMYRKFVPNGEDLADAVMNFRFEQNQNI